MKDHELRALVDEITKVARDFGGAQQLRERIAHVVRPAISESVAELHRHKKTGGVYEVICNAARESDGELLIVYRNTATGERWVRPAAEFNDGRFEAA